MSTLATTVGLHILLQDCPKSQSLPIDDEKVKVARSRPFGSWEMNWIGYNFAQDVTLPGSELGPIAFLCTPEEKHHKAVSTVSIQRISAIKISSREISAVPISAVGD